MNIAQCNNVFREKTLHPLVSVIDLGSSCLGVSQSSIVDWGSTTQVRPDCYCILVMTNVCKEGEYGLRSYDFRDGTLLFNVPSKTVDIRLCEDNPIQGKLLLFHPCLLVGTPLGKHISGYSFFKYRKEEALHVSAAELRDILHVVSDIEHELKRGVDDFSARILSNDIELFLNFCLRFYHRQFIMRHDAFPCEFERFRAIVDEYLKSGKVRRTGMPCGACRFTSQMDMSAAYLNDLVRNETGKSVSGYAQLRRVELAKQMIIADRDSDAKIALTLGYANVSEFRQLFERLTGVSTDAYRHQ